jgi:uncharacterized phage protein (TIGR02220 family)
MLIWVLAAGSEGLLPYDEKFIAARIGATDTIDLDALVAAGLLTVEEGPDLVALKGNGEDQDTQARANAERRRAAKSVLAFLNEKTGKRFREVEANLKLITARLAEFDETMLRSIIVHRVQLWAADAKMAEYLRPATLFSATNCAQYAGEIEGQ